MVHCTMDSLPCPRPCSHFPYPRHKRTHVKLLRFSIGTDLHQDRPGSVHPNRPVVAGLRRGPRAAAGQSPAIPDRPGSRNPCVGAWGSRRRPGTGQYLVVLFCSSECELTPYFCLFPTRPSVALLDLQQHNSGAHCCGELGTGVQSDSRQGVFVCVCVWLSGCPSVRLSVPPSVCPSACLPACLSMRPPLLSINIRLHHCG